MQMHLWVAVGHLSCDLTLRFSMLTHQREARAPTLIVARILLLSPPMLLLVRIIDHNDELFQKLRIVPIPSRLTQSLLFSQPTATHRPSSETSTHCTPASLPARQSKPNSLRRWLPRLRDYSTWFRRPS
jgi:hypothetical protein